VAYIIAEPCIGTKDSACVDVCPVDCIHPAKGRTYESFELSSLACFVRAFLAIGFGVEFVARTHCLPISVVFSSNFSNPVLFF